MQVINLPTNKSGDGFPSSLNFLLIPLIFSSFESPVYFSHKWTAVSKDFKSCSDIFNERVEIWDFSSWFSILLHLGLWSTISGYGWIKVVDYSLTLCESHNTNEAHQVSLDFLLLVCGLLLWLWIKIFHWIIIWFWCAYFACKNRAFSYTSLKVWVNFCNKNPRFPLDETCRRNNALRILVSDLYYVNNR